jgi:cholesterol oxidase
MHSVAVAFTEEMKGHCAFGTDDFVSGWDEGRRSTTELMFHLTISVDDIHRFETDVMHEALAIGWVQCPAIGDGRLEVVRGSFNLFAPGLASGRTTMRYRLWFCDGAGRPLTLVGYKDVGDDPGLDLWHDTTSLYTSLLDGHVESGFDGAAPTRAKGILFIKPLDFAKQLTTFRGRPSAIARFERLFLAALWRTYRGRAKRTAR